MTGQARNFKNKTVIITGGGSGVGFECAKIFAGLGANSLIIGRNADKLSQAAQSLENYEGKTLSLSGDVANPDMAKQIMTQAKEQFGRIDVLINNAGLILRKTAQDTSDSEWAQLMAVNVTGVFNLSRAFANRAEDHSAIINLSSTCGQFGAAGLAAYCASKGAVNQLTRAMALELAPRKITVNAVAPGAINSPMLFSQHHDSKMAETVVERNLESIPIGSIAEPQEIARAILYLASEPHITGTILNIDGGYTAV